MSKINPQHLSALIGSFNRLYITTKNYKSTRTSMITFDLEDVRYTLAIHYYYPRIRNDREKIHFRLGRKDFASLRSKEAVVDVINPKRVRITVPVLCTAYKDNQDRRLLVFNETEERLEGTSHEFRLKQENLALSTNKNLSSLLCGTQEELERPSSNSWYGL